jgi:flagellar assembly protein FliH
MKLLPKIIKSFRIIEKEELDEENIVSQDDRDKNLADRKVLLKEAKRQYRIIVNDAEEKAQSILEKANRDNENYLNDTYERAKKILEESKNEGYEKGYKDGTEEGYEDGTKKGYEEGYGEGKRKSDILIQEALEIKKDYLSKRDSIYKDIEKDVISLVIDICEKILYERMDENKEQIVSLVLKGIESLKPVANITVIVSKYDYDIVEMSKANILSRASLVDEMEVKVDSNLGKGDCIIETSKGSVDVSLTNQINEVKKLLNNILSSE